VDPMLADLLADEGGMSPQDIQDCEALTQDSDQSLDRLLVGKGFLQVSASPLTRSSHHAGEDFAKLQAARAAKQR